MSDHNEVIRRITIEFRWNRRFFFSVIVVLIVLGALTTIALALAHTNSNTASPSLALTAPTVVSYQGRVTVNGVPFNGTGQFKFTVVNADGTIAYWSNDGTGLLTAPFTPTNSVAVNVSNGLFTVLLGDASLPNMTQPMKPDAFASPDRKLRIWFNDGTHGFSQLTPDTRVGSAPYALNAEFARTSPNLQRIALRRWYATISTTQSIFSVGNGPRDAAFDGENMWITNRDGGTVSVLRASDGRNVGNYPVAGPPWGLAYDGANMWIVGNIDPGTVSVIRARDGVQIMTPTVAPWPYGIAFDGSNMWVTGGGYGSGHSVDVLRTSDGSHAMTLTVGEGPAGIAFDGTNMWIANSISNTVSVVRAADGFFVMTPTVGQRPVAIGFDGVNMWIANQLGKSINVLRASDGYRVMTLTLSLEPNEFAFDGVNMWVTSQSSNYASIFRTSDGAAVMNVPVGIHSVGLAFDGANMWIVDLSSNSVYKR